MFNNAHAMSTDTANILTTAIRNFLRSIQQTDGPIKAPLETLRAEISSQLNELEYLRAFQDDVPASSWLDILTYRDPDQVDQELLSHILGSGGSANFGYQRRDVVQNEIVTLGNANVLNVAGLNPTLIMALQPTPSNETLTPINVTAPKNLTLGANDYASAVALLANNPALGKLEEIGTYFNNTDVEAYNSTSWHRIDPMGLSGRIMKVKPGYGLDVGLDDAWVVLGTDLATGQITIGNFQGSWNTCSVTHPALMAIAKPA